MRCVLGFGDTQMALHRTTSAAAVDVADARLFVALAPDSLTGQEACLGSFTPISDGSMLSYGFAAVARIALYK